MSTSSFASVRRFVVVTAALVLIGVCLTRPKAEDEPQDGVQVLFIGNSFTYYHELPKMIAALAQAGRQRPLVVHTEVPGGYTLERHWNEGKALAKLTSRKWDFVVLQDQSQTPLTNRKAMFEFGKKFAAQIEKQGAKTILYQTWAKQDEPKNQAKISEAYVELGRN